MQESEIKSTASTLEQRQAEFAEAHGLTLEQYKKLVKLPFNEITICLLLLKVKSFRSGYRALCARKVRLWLNGESVTFHPLTDRELANCAPQHPIDIQLPR